ncbi:MAG TPA: hypothetical protein VKB46_02580 [Pyrinomonadaceae bacterium]|nr:hypothetical protein [Pyrinomonadaceae bacterium]
MTRVLALVLAFTVGVFSSAVVSRQRSSRQAEKSLLLDSRIDQWHRLYEAAGMTGDGEIRVEVFNRLLCSDRAGRSLGLMIDVDGLSKCRLDDGTLQELNPPGDYGPFAKRILESHLDWSLNNLDFVESVSSAAKARQYVSRHQWPQ